MSATRQAPDGRRVRRTVAAATVGTALEWYDFYIYGNAAALVFPKLFFPESGPYLGLLASLATFGVGFFARPLGAAIFGHIGDRLGRKVTLMVTMLLMGGASLAIGLLPTYSAIGVLAPTLLVLLRLVQGIGVGGEWGGAVLITMEQNTKNRRGFFASWTGFGAPLGAVISTAVMLLASRVFGDGFHGTGMLAGWRWPFYLSIVLVAVGMFVRLRLTESPAFAEARAHGRTERRPLLRLAAQNPKQVLLAALMRAAEVGTYYIFAAFILSYGTEHLGRSNDFLLLGVTVAAALTLFTVPYMGWLSDRFGRRRVMLAGVIITAAWTFPYFGLLETKHPVVVFVAIAASLLPWSVQYGPQPAMIAEAFPTNVRASGAGLGYQLGGAVWGGFGPLIAAAVQPISVWMIPAYMLLLCVMTATGLLLLPDRSRMSLSEVDSAGGSAVDGSEVSRREVADGRA